MLHKSSTECYYIFTVHKYKLQQKYGNKQSRSQDFSLGGLKIIVRLELFNNPTATSSTTE